MAWITLCMKGETGIVLDQKGSQIAGNECVWVGLDPGVVTQKADHPGADSQRVTLTLQPVTMAPDFLAMSSN